MTIGSVIGSEVGGSVGSVVGGDETIYAYGTVVVLGIGESGMVGYGDLLDPLPAGYPPMNGRLLKMQDDFVVVEMDEPLEEEVTPIDTVLSENMDPTDPEVGFAGMACWRFMARCSAAVSIIYLGCGRSGSTSEQWSAASRSRTTRYGATLARVSKALDRNNVVLGAVFMNQGINDAHTLQDPSDWAENWTAIKAKFDTDVGVVPHWYYTRFWDDPPGGSWTDPNWSTMLAEQDGWADLSSSAKRVPVQAPDGGFIAPDNVHLDTNGNIELSVRTDVAMGTYRPQLPVVTYTGVTTLPAGANVQAEWISSHGLTLDGSDRVSQWLDTTDTYAITQGTSTRRPLRVASALNGEPAIRYLRSRQDILTGTVTAALASVGDTNSHTIYTVARTVNVGAYAPILSMASTPRDDFVWLGHNNATTGGYYTRARDGAGAGPGGPSVGPAGTYDASNLVVHAFVFYGGSELEIIQHANGDQIVYTGGQGDVTTLNEVSIGGFPGAFYWDGDIFDVIICAGAHSIAMRVAVQMALRNRYGVALPT